MTGLAVERSALLDPVAMGEFGLNLCGGVGWRDGFRPIAVLPDVKVNDCI